MEGGRKEASKTYLVAGYHVNNGLALRPGKHYDVLRKSYPSRLCIVRSACCQHSDISDDSLES